MSDLVTAKEAAEIFKTSLQNIYTMKSKKKIKPASHDERGMLFLRSDVVTLRARTRLGRPPEKFRNA